MYFKSSKYQKGEPTPDVGVPLGRYL